ncbi:integrase catalytic domain-containing protein [Trichonephila clavipes]|nr:integrase catalytic domain-containing protein [Trichonephila clavipes]
MRKDVESIRYPIVLPSRHPIVTKLIIQKHIELLHAGVQTVMSALRENYWILKSRKTVRRVLSECIICKRFTVRPLTTFSPPLPEDRKSPRKACLTYEELYTVVCDSESVINSRPLTYLSEDQEDLVALTPAMFLQEIKENGVPDLDLIDSQRMNRRFLYRQRIRQELRKRFRLEYLGQLKSFSKSRKEDVIKEGDIVLIVDTNSKRIYWPLAKVIKLIPGRDGRVRVVEVSTSSGSFLRPIQRLYPLEVSGTDISDLPEQIKETLKDRV